MGANFTNRWVRGNQFSHSTLPHCCLWLFLASCGLNVVLIITILIRFDFLWKGTELKGRKFDTQRRYGWLLTVTKNPYKQFLKELSQLYLSPKCKNHYINKWKWLSIPDLGNTEGGLQTSFTVVEIMRCRQKTHNYCSLHSGTMITWRLVVGKLTSKIISLLARRTYAGLCFMHTRNL